MADLRAVFGSDERGLSAGEAFTSWQDQWGTVTTVLGAHMRRVSSPQFDVEDLESPRRNVLVFHGVGGIGKSTLSRKLEAALAGGSSIPPQWGPPAWDGKRVVPVRIDLAASAGFDFERLVLTLRLALTGLGRPLPAFDLALRRYWEHQHPDKSLEEYLRRGGLARFGEALPQQLQSVLADVAQTLMLPGNVGSLVGQVTTSLVGALRERRQTVRALAGCARLIDLLEAEPDLEALSFYPHLLAWELGQLSADKRVTPIVLLDTFEDVGDRTHRDLERLVQRVVWLMPNSFFIVTGRSRLQWGDGALHGQLDWTGPAAWPGLAEPTPTQLPNQRSAPSTGQVLMGDLSPEDCEAYLACRLARNGESVIPAAIRRLLAQRSCGLPLYLDLAVMRFLEIRRGGRCPQPADFDHDFPALIARTLSGLTPEERTVLRAVTLLDAFDVDLATRTAGLPRQAPALRLTERPFVRQDPGELWPFQLHALIRSSIRNADEQSDDSWSEQDWQRAAHRAHTALGEVWRTASGQPRRRLVACLRQGLALARDYGLELGWLEEAAWHYVSDSGWEPLAPTANQEREQAVLETAADALAETLSALARRQHEHRERTAARLQSVLDADLLPASLQEMPRYYLAKAHRDLGDSTASRRGMQRVAEGGGRLAPAAARGLAHLARLTGDFPTALQTARTLGWEGRGRRVEAGIRWVHGEMDRAAIAYAEARDQAEEHGIAGERALCQTHRALVLAFTDPNLAADEIDLADQLLTGLDLRTNRMILRVASLARDAGQPGPDVADRAQLLRTETSVAGVVATETMLELALAFHHAVRDERDQIDEAVNRLRARAPGDNYAFYSDLVLFMADQPLREPSTAHWLDEDEANVRRRWRTLVTARRALTSPAPR
ncbi:ATP/GTP-binding protein [Streptomyces sp. NPDC001939]